jgi:hypothetical protein
MKMRFWRARPARPAGVATPTAAQFARYQRTRHDRTAPPAKTSSPRTPA